MVEFWCVATRPLDVNGLGLSPSRTNRILSRLERFCELVPETPSVFQEWRRLVITNQVLGKKAYDARLVAFMIAHGIKSILTLNVRDFARYPEVTAIDPITIV
jgi:predicted nucleic acid-binding protein